MNSLDQYYFYEEMLGKVCSGDLKLPILPEVAMEVREVVNDSDSDIGMLSKAISKDAILSVKLIRAANSAVARGTGKVEDVKTAVMRLGMSYAANLSIGLSMEQVYRPKNIEIERMRREAWNNSVSVASMCQIFTHFCTTLSSDKGLLAGLVHNIGVLPILMYAEENGLVKDMQTLNYLINGLHPLVGSKLLECWGFSEDIRIVPLECLNFRRTAEEPDYVDVVTVCMLEDYLKGKIDVDEVLEGVSAFRRLNVVDGLFESNNDLQNAAKETISIMS